MKEHHKPGPRKVPIAINTRTGVRAEFTHCPDYPRPILSLVSLRRPDGTYIWLLPWWSRPPAMCRHHEHAWGDGGCPGLPHRRRRGCHLHLIFFFLLLPSPTYILLFPLASCYKASNECPA